MNKTNVLVTGVAVVALLVSVLAFAKPNPVERVIERVVGSASSPSVVGGCMDVNGVSHCYFSQRLNFGSTTCAFKAPAGASSTLEYATINVTDAKGSNFDVEFGKGNTAFATTTSLGYAGIQTAAGFTAYASTTPVDLSDPTIVFNPADFLNVKIGSTTPSSLMKGRCTAVFNVL